MTAEILEDGCFETPAWRQTAPRARKIAMALFGWRDPGWVFLAAVLAATPFVIACAMAPALLSLSPTAETLSPVANALAISAGAGDPLTQSAPFFLALITLADRFVDAPGRTLLVAKAIAAVLAAYPMAYFVSVRLPTVAGVGLTAAIAAFVVAPFNGPSDMALAYFMVVATALVLSPADEGWDRAIFEGLLCGGLMFALWLLNPAFALASLLVLSACPFLTGFAGLARYATAFGGLLTLVILAEIAAPGINLSRASAASALATAGAGAAGRGVGAWGVAGAAASTIAVIGAAWIFGGREHVRSWGAAAGFMMLAFLAALAAGAQSAPAFALAASIAVFSVASPFYDGVFRDHDRASIVAAGVAAALTLFWIGATCAHAAGQLALQHRSAAAAPSAVRAALGVVHPSAEQLAEWARRRGAMAAKARSAGGASIDQSEILLEAAERAIRIVQEGASVALLTGADLACVLAPTRDCRPDGRAAAADARIVLVPRVDLTPAAKAEKERSEALLYTQFKLAERTPAWEIWVRRSEGL
ncbi:MAG: hypothetical protein AAFX08_09460 [Pseudomonadota bacterium]